MTKPKHAFFFGKDLGFKMLKPLFTIISCLFRKVFESEG